MIWHLSQLLQDHGQHCKCVIKKCCSYSVFTQGFLLGPILNLDPHSLVNGHKFCPVTSSLDLPLLLSLHNDTSRLPVWLLFGLLPCLKSPSTSWSGAFRPVELQALESRPCLAPQACLSENRVPNPVLLRPEVSRAITTKRWPMICSI